MTSAAGPHHAMNAVSPADTLAQEQQATRALIDLLQQEQAYLISADIDSLNMVTERKAPLVAKLTELANLRHRSLANSGHPASETGMQEWLDTKSNGKPAYPTAKTQWSTLIAMAKQAKEVNRVNGILINTHLTRNQGALNVLQVQTNSGNFYGPDGQATAAKRGRGLVVG
jgi:flagella synthesis protein FlgN